MDARTKLILTEITQQFEKRFSVLIDICESPIEEFFLINICKYFYGESLMSLNFDFLVKTIDNPFNPNTQTIKPSNYQELDVFGFIYGIQVKPTNDITYNIIPQYQVKNYRLDFAIFIERPNSKIKFCIECDGLEYHRSAQQIKNDSNRARDLAQDGWITLRYTGTELFNWDAGNALKLELILTKFLEQLN